MNERADGVALVWLELEYWLDVHRATNSTLIKLHRMQR
jgi:hypothetical protein